MNASSPYSSLLVINVGLNRSHVHVSKKVTPPGPFGFLDKRVEPLQTEEERFEPHPECRFDELR
jgi:hypothetical protein